MCCHERARKVHGAARSTLTPAQFKYRELDSQYCWTHVTVWIRNTRGLHSAAVAFLRGRCARYVKIGSFGSCALPAVLTPESPAVSGCFEPAFATATPEWSHAPPYGSSIYCEGGCPRSATPHQNVCAQTWRSSRTAAGAMCRRLGAAAALAAAAALPPAPAPRPLPQPMPVHSRRYSQPYETICCLTNAEFKTCTLLSLVLVIHACGPHMWSWGTHCTYEAESSQPRTLWSDVQRQRCGSADPTPELHGAKRLEFGRGNTFTSSCQSKWGRTHPLLLQLPGRPPPVRPAVSGQPLQVVSPRQRHQVIVVLLCHLDHVTQHHVIDAESSSWSDGSFVWRLCVEGGESLP